MSTRINISDIAARLAERMHLSPADAETRVREFFLSIEEALRSDSIVKIKNLGTFKLVRVEARQSININTGQRFTIDPHTKITFTPDTALRNQINKPFSEFETVPLSDSLSLEELDSIVSEAADQDEVVDQDIAEDDKVEETVVETVGGEVEEKVEEQGKVEEEIEEKVEKIEKAEEKVEDVVEDVVDKTPLNNIKEETEPKENAPTQLRIDSQHVAQQHIQRQIVETQNTMAQPASARLTIWETLALLIFILTLMALSYAAGYNHWLAPAESNSAQHSQPVEKTTNASAQGKNRNNTLSHTEAPQADPVLVTPVAPATPVMPAPKADPAASFPQVPGSTYVIVGVQCEHTIRIGDSLRGISLRYFGSKDYVPHIVALNHITNPDIVNVGTVLKIPKLEKRENKITKN